MAYVQGTCLSVKAESSEMWLSPCFQEKQPKSRSEPNSGTSLKTPAAKRGQQSVLTEPTAVSESSSKSSLESSEAVSQLLNAVPVGGQMPEMEWEEVIISEGHFLPNNVLSEDRRSTVGVVLGQESQRQADASSEQAEKGSVGLGMSTSSEVSSPNASVKKPVLGWVSFPCVKGAYDVYCVLMGLVQEIEGCWQCFLSDLLCLLSVLCQFRIVPFSLCPSELILF